MPRTRPIRDRDADWLASHPKRAVKPPVRLNDDSAPDPLDRIRPTPVPDGERRAARVMLAAAARQLHLDLAEPGQRRAALRHALPVLEAIGLTGDEALRSSPAERKLIGSRFVHGTRSAVEAHADTDTPLCGPCQRWVDVQSRRGARPGEAGASRTRTG